MGVHGAMLRGNKKLSLSGSQEEVGCFLLFSGYIFLISLETKRKAEMLLLPSAHQAFLLCPPRAALVGWRSSGPMESPEQDALEHISQTDTPGIAEHLLGWSSKSLSSQRVAAEGRHIWVNKGWHIWGAK